MASSASDPADTESSSTSSISSMKSYYLKNEPFASTTLRHLANGLNAIAFQTLRSPESFSAPFIGFDLEWKPNFRSGESENPVAVVQIAYRTASYVVHVRWMRHLPDGLAEILENPRIVKVGVGIQNDAKKLYRDLGICLNSCVDLSLFVKCVDSGLFAERLDRYADIPISPSVPSPPPPSLPSDCPPWEFYKSETFLGPYFHRLFRGPYSIAIGLARLAEVYEGLVLVKGKISRSNWDVELTPVQITYAALDAYAGYVVYDHLVKLFNLLEPTKRPKRKFYAFDCIRGRLYHCCGHNRRTLPGEQMEDTELPHLAAEYPTVPIFHPVEEEIALHLQGVGSDQPHGFVIWTPSNPEYDPGPMQPKKTPEEVEAARQARQKRNYERRKKEGQNQVDSEIGTVQDENANVNQIIMSADSRVVPQSRDMGANRGHPMTNALNRYSEISIASSTLHPELPSPSTAGSDGITALLQDMKIHGTPGSSTSISTSQAPASLSNTQKPEGFYRPPEESHRSNPEGFHRRSHNRRPKYMKSTFHSYPRPGGGGG
ncbi:hypothetical protein J3R30DRAFT_3704162 [Lentinula aciculospora]|uniref:3'-5' exonuclease n=1 Tax=Lentinula aciculospora TaxID=153920 RepID=A0A9W9DMX9_9AGAR|nr:hypothetical protein J3R30DRAFT_3704162 [Lentinula aciculospora]